MLASISFAAACKKSSVETQNAQVTGIDMRKCASPYCGGWFIEIGGETKRFLEVPADTDIDFNAELQFPIPVEVQWEKYDNWWGDIDDLIKVKKLYKAD